MSEYVCGYAIKFSDGGDPELRILRRGDKTECERMLELLPAIAYSGDRPGAEGMTWLIPAAEWDEYVTEGEEP